MAYKIGDKVRIIKSKAFPDEIGWVCEVIEEASSGSRFACRVYYEPNNWNCLMYPCEIEKVPVYAKGEQMIFEFMK